jgi:hypothetical protein
MTAEKFPQTGNGLRVALAGGGRKLDNTRAQRRHGKLAQRLAGFYSANRRPRIQTKMSAAPAR